MTANKNNMSKDVNPLISNSSASGNTSIAYRRYVLLILTLVYAFNFIDRQIIGILSPFIREDLGLDDAQLGWLKGFAFALLFTVVGIPIAWLADRYSRVNIVAISLTAWSGFTVLSGFATNFTQMALARVGVGIGEAGGSPPSHSMISDLYDANERAKALAIYSLGIPFGIMTAYFAAAAFLGSGTVNDGGSFFAHSNDCCWAARHCTGHFDEVNY